MGLHMHVYIYCVLSDKVMLSLIHLQMCTHMHTNKRKHTCVCLYVPVNLYVLYTHTCMCVRVLIDHCVSIISSALKLLSSIICE